MSAPVGCVPLDSKAVPAAEEPEFEFLEASSPAEGKPPLKAPEARAPLGLGIGR